jgi:hypothetical protein
VVSLLLVFSGSTVSTASLGGDGYSSCELLFSAAEARLTQNREGSATVGIGAICCFFLPEYPYNAKLLTPIERQVAVYRLEKEAGAGEGTEDIGTWQGFKIGLKDIKVGPSLMKNDFFRADCKVYLMIFCNMMSQAQGSIANFFPSIVKTLGYGTTVTLLLCAPLQPRKRRVMLIKCIGRHHLTSLLLATISA